jgi:hypothetical protein
MVAQNRRFLGFTQALGPASAGSYLPTSLGLSIAWWSLLLANRAQRQGFRRYVEGLLLADERNKTLTALANTEPVVGAQRKEAQSLQWFLSKLRLPE